MGNYILCSHKSAEIPYYIESVSLNIYSIEELCYFIANYIPLADITVVNKELASWIKNEAGMSEAAGVLETMLDEKDSFNEAVKWVLKCGNYYNKTQLEKIYEKLDAYQSMEIMWQRKARADMLMEQKKYIKAIENYKEILDTVGISEQPKTFRGKVYYDLGCGYAKLFRLSKARENLRKAYALLPEEKIRKAVLAAAYLDGKEEALSLEAKKLSADEAEIKAIMTEMEAIDAPAIEGSLDELTKKWVRDYHDSTGL